MSACTAGSRTRLKKRCAILWFKLEAKRRVASEVAAGVQPSMIRVSVGYEEIEDIKKDFSRAIAAAKGQKAVGTSDVTLEASGGCCEVS